MLAVQIDGRFTRVNPCLEIGHIRGSVEAGA
jgi:hypothetical protein